MVKKNKFAGPLKIFISHRHDDKKIADSVKSVLQEWGNGQIKIYQSSDVRVNGYKIGMKLTDEQKIALTDTNIVILIYTVSDDDWYYCMWESGIATNKNGQDTRILVFKCASDLPESLLGEMCVTPDESSIKVFSKDFHKKSNFFPGLYLPFAPDIDEEVLITRSYDMFNKLSGLCQI